MARILKKSGFSLMEMLVTMLIFGIMTVGTYGVFMSAQEFWVASKTQVELQQETRKAMQRMINELRQSGNLSITNVPADGTWYSTITFKTPSGVTTGSITWNADTIHSIFPWRHRRNSAFADLRGRDSSGWIGCSNLAVSQACGQFKYFGSLHFGPED
jgi:prepilin-type N-terminal cleavage/methylation domain-containing protein